MDFTFKIFCHFIADAKFAPQTYFIDVTIRNKWRNTVYMTGPSDGQITTIILKAGETKQQIFVKTADSRPEPRFFKVVDEDVGNLIKVDGKSDGIVMQYHEQLTPIVIDIQDYGKCSTLQKKEVYAQ